MSHPFTLQALLTLKAAQDAMSAARNCIADAPKGSIEMAAWWQLLSATEVLQLAEISIANSIEARRYLKESA